MRTEYLLRTPAYDELRCTFGSLDHAYRATGGDIPTLCFYLANPERIPALDSEWSYPGAAGSYASELKQAALQEVVEEAFNASERRTIADVQRKTGRSRSTIRRALVCKRLWPKNKKANADDNFKQ